MLVFERLPKSSLHCILPKKQRIFQSDIQTAGENDGLESVLSLLWNGKKRYTNAIHFYLVRILHKKLHVLTCVMFLKFQDCYPFAVFIFYTQKHTASTCWIFQ